jgi:hypothetical protein
VRSSVLDSGGLPGLRRALQHRRLEGSCAGSICETFTQALWGAVAFEFMLFAAFVASACVACGSAGCCAKEPRNQVQAMPMPAQQMQVQQMQMQMQMVPAQHMQGGAVPMPVASAVMAAPPGAPPGAKGGPAAMATAVVLAPGSVPRFCSNCGAPATGSNFCAGCGTASG